MTDILGINAKDGDPDFDLRSIKYWLTFCKSDEGGVALKKIEEAAIRLHSKAKSNAKPTMALGQDVQVKYPRETYPYGIH